MFNNNNNNNKIIKKVTLMVDAKSKIKKVLLNIMAGKLSYTLLSDWAKINIFLTETCLIIIRNFEAMTLPRALLIGLWSGRV